jgi:hypothetical protein
MLSTWVAYGFGYLRQKPMVVVDQGYWYWMSFWNSLTMLGAEGEARRGEGRLMMR